MEEQKIQNGLPENEEATENKKCEIAVVWDDENTSASRGLKTCYGLGSLTLLLIPLALLPLGLFPALIIVFIAGMICKSRFYNKTKPISGVVRMLKDPAEKDLIQKIKDYYDLVASVRIWLILIMIGNLLISVFLTSEYIEEIGRINNIYGNIYGTYYNNGFFETYLAFVLVETPAVFINILLTLFLQ